mmetsp:Transcript_5587/g.16562  ORF Transcript_5587/g.16562 Transcript_5587/m.16562 type:complete len:155 (+) Transcript_5587:2065-2529(+)
MADEEALALELDLFDDDAFDLLEDDFALTDDEFEDDPFVVPEEELFADFAVDDDDDTKVAAPEATFAAADLEMDFADDFVDDDDDDFTDEEVAFAADWDLAAFTAGGFAVLRSMAIGSGRLLCLMGLMFCIGCGIAGGRGGGSDICCGGDMCMA